MTIKNSMMTSILCDMIIQYTGSDNVCAAPLFAVHRTFYSCVVAFVTKSLITARTKNNYTILMLKVI